MKRIMILTLLLAACDPATAKKEQPPKPPPVVKDEAPPELIAGELDLTVVVAETGSTSIAGKTYIRGEQPWEVGRIIELFRQRRAQEKYRKPDNPNRASYTLFIRLHPNAPFSGLQAVMMSAVMYGGITRMVLESTDGETQAEIKIPVDPGLSRDPFEEPPEVRVVACAGGNIGMHLGAKSEHAKAEKTTDEIHLQVDTTKIGVVAGDTAKIEDLMMKDLVNNVGFARKKPDDAKATIIIDADEPVPCRFILAVIAALQADGLDNIQIVASTFYRGG